MSGKGTVLVIDDDDSMLEFCATTLRLEGWDVQTASTGMEALHEFTNHPTQIVLTDYICAPDRRSIIEMVKSTHPQSEVVVMTGMPSLETAMISFAEGARHYLAKPFRLEALLNAMQDCLKLNPRPMDKPAPEATWLKEAMRDYFKSIRARREAPRMPAILAVDERLSHILYRVALDLRMEAAPSFKI